MVYFRGWETAVDDPVDSVEIDPVDKLTPDIPRTLGFLWGRETQGTRGPRRSLDVEQIGRAAVRVADAEGLGAISMKRVAEELGVTAMALYRYVESKDDLFLVMMEMASDVPGRESSLGWRGAAEKWCRDYRSLLMEHPWMLQVPLAGPPATPRQLAWMEAVVVALEATGLTVAEQMQVLLQLNVYVRGDVALYGSLVTPGEGEGVSNPWARLVTQLAPEERYPAIYRIISTGEFDEDDDPTEQFEFGLERILDGIERLVEERRQA
jgi:AcrR family transcriptional regulator